MNMSPDILKESLPKRRYNRKMSLSRSLSHSSTSLARLVNFRGEFQDAESVLSTQMLVAAIILSIVVTLHTGTFSHDALVEGDVRHATFDHLRGKDIAEDTYERFISGRLIIDGYVAVSSSTLSLILSAILYVSLILSGSRGDATLFKRWWRFGRIWVVLVYLLVVISIVFFLKLNHDSVYMVYPKYNWNANFSLPLDTFAEDARRLATATGRTDVGSGSVTYASEGSDRYFGKDVSEVSKLFKFGMNLVLVVCTSLISLGHVWVVCWYEKPEEPAPSGVSPPRSPSANTMCEAIKNQTRLIREQNELLRQILRADQPRGSWEDVDLEVGAKSEMFDEQARSQSSLDIKKHSSVF